MRDKSRHYIFMRNIYFMLDFLAIDALYIVYLEYQSKYDEREYGSASATTSTD